MVNHRKWKRSRTTPYLSCWKRTQIRLVGWLMISGVSLLRLRRTWQKLANWYTDLSLSLSLPDPIATIEISVQRQDEKEQFSIRLAIFFKYLDTKQIIDLYWQESPENSLRQRGKERRQNWSEQSRSTRAQRQRRRKCRKLRLLDSFIQKEKIIGLTKQKQQQQQRCYLLEYLL